MRLQMLGGYKLATERGVAQLPTVGGRRPASKKPEREEFLPRTEGCRIIKAMARLGAEYLRRYRTNMPCAGEGGAVCLGAPKVVTIMGAPQEECAAEKAGQVREAVRNRMSKSSEAGASTLSIKIAYRGR